MKFIEFNEEEFKKDTDTTEFNNLEIVNEAIATLQESYFRKNDGFRRIEKVSLLAIYLLQQENQELKKQLEDTNEELELVRCDLHNRTSERDGCYRNIEILENQQKEFIEYLEDNIKKYEDKLEKCPFMSGILTLPISFWKDELSKYKEIIGGKDE